MTAFPHNPDRLDAIGDIARRAPGKGGPQSSVSGSVIASQDRSLPLRRRPELILQDASTIRDGLRVVKDPVSRQYWQLTAEQSYLLMLLDQPIGLAAIRERLVQRFPQSDFELSQVQQMLLALHGKGLLISQRVGRAEQLEQSPRETRTRLAVWLARVMFVKLPGFNASRILDALEPLSRILLHPSAVGIAVLFVLSSWSLLAIQFEAYEASVAAMPGLLSWSNVFALWLAVGAAKVLHELAHAIVCRHFGGECSEVGIAFLMCSPCLYCDVSDAWMLPDKRRRILIALAGPAAELLISACCLQMWWFTRPGLLNQVVLSLFLVSTASALLLNLNPLLKYDGYYVLSDLLGVPNLRDKADRKLRALLLNGLLGQRVPTRRDDSNWLAAYGLAAMGYRWMILFSITVFLFSVLKPWGMHWLAFLFAGLNLLAASTVWFSRVAHEIRASGGSAVKPFRVTLAVTAVAAGVFWMMTWQLPIHGTAPCVIEPQGVRHLFAESDAELQQSFVQPGQVVRAEQPVIQLVSRELELRRDMEANEVARLEADVRLLTLAGDQPGKALAVEAAELARQRKQRAVTQIDEMTVRAPLDGVVVAIDHQSETGRGNGQSQAISGSVLDEENQGAFVERGRHLVSIAPGTGWQAVLIVDEELRDSLRESQPVQLRLDGLPGQVVRGTVERVGSRDIVRVPSQLVRNGYLVPNVSPGASAAHNSAGTCYAVTVRIDDPLFQGVTGMCGTARFVIEQPTVAEWMTRNVLDIVHVRM